MQKTNDINKHYQKAWVVFCQDTDIWWLRFLKRGFRHCFLILNDGYHWITYDPMSCFTEITVQKTPIDFNLPQWFSQRGDTVIQTRINRYKKIAPLSIFTCVESVKRALGIHNLWILTPRHLYIFLQRKENQYGNSKL